jgi:hypothetical protein
MTAPVPPGRVQAPPLTATETRQEAVARAIRRSWLRLFDMQDDWDQAEDYVRDRYREMAAAAITADDAWRAGQAGCGHPNHGSPDHDCTPFLAALAPADHEPADGIQRVLAVADELEADAQRQVDTYPDDSDALPAVVGRSWVNAARQFRSAVRAETTEARR